MTDLNQLTISGHVEHRPQLQNDPDCGTVCRFVLTHTVELPDSERFSAEIQSYNVAIYGPLGQSFANVYQPNQRIIIEGRLDCDWRQTPTGPEAITSILVDSLTATPEFAEDHSTDAPAAA